jgi:hypothetical protein
MYPMVYDLIETDTLPPLPLHGKIEVDGTASGMLHYLLDGESGVEYGDDMMERLKNLLLIQALQNMFELELNQMAYKIAENTISPEFDFSWVSYNQIRNGPSLLWLDPVISTTAGSFDVYLSGDCLAKLTSDNGNKCTRKYMVQCKVETQVSDNYNFRGGNNILKWWLIPFGTEYDISGTWNYEISFPVVVLEGD